MLVGVVDTNKVLTESKSGQAVGKRLQQIGAHWQQQIALAEQRLEDAQGRAAKAAADAPASQLFKLQHETRMLELTLRHTQEMAQTELEAHSEYLQAVLSQALAAELEKIGKAKNLSMVLTGPSANIPFVAQSIDVTQDVITSFDGSFREQDI